MINNIAFTDPQGQQFTDAVFLVATMNFSQSVGRNHIRDINDFTTLHVDESDWRALNVQYYYWASQAAFDNRANGTAPYLLANMAGDRTTTFRIEHQELIKPKYDAITFEQVAELYLTDVVLPTLNP